MRIKWRTGVLGALIAASLMLTNGSVPAADAPVVHVSAAVTGTGVRLQAEADGPFEYTTYRPSATLYVVDLSGVAVGDSSGARIVASDLVKSYRVLSYSSGAKPVVRMEILLAQGVEPRIERSDNRDLTLVVSKIANASLSAEAPANTQPPAGGVALVPAAAKASDGGSSVEAIRQVSLAQNGNQTEVTISGSGSLTYRSQRLRSPERLVLDFARSRLATSEKHIPSNLDPVREIRMAQFTPEVSRVVIDLRKPAHYVIHGSGSGVTVSFAPNETTGASVSPASDSAPIVSIKSVAPAVGDAELKSAAVMPTSIPAPAAVLPVAFTQPASGLAIPAPSAARQEGPAAITLAHNVSSTIASSPNLASPSGDASSSVPAPERTASSTAAQAASKAPQKFSGEPISVNLKDVDLHDFFRLIHEISGLNVVVDPSVKGTLTIVLDDVPWDQALDIVLRNNDLDKQLDGNVLRIATKATLRREAEENRDLAKAQAEAADVVTTTRVLSYAKATDMATTLKKFLSSRGDIISDDRSNTLIIRDIPSTLPVMDNLIRQLDRKSQQVEIEARVVAANRSFARELGTQLAAALGTGHSTLGGASAVGTSPVTHFPAPPFCVGTCAGTNPPTPGTLSSGNMPLLTNLGANVPTSGFSYIFQNGEFALDEIITAAEDRGVGKLLSKPKVITQNNEKATVKQGTKIPVSTIINNTVSVQFVDAVLELDVTPQITADGTIYMDVTVENDQIDASIPRVQGIPAIDTQATETKVTVSDGATVVIGGIIVTQ
ncbi:MAG TPA: type IV pilus secretin PilQ, partial [Candidatus Acidoferrales bacterium]|nr:type IV pilus secretin PilQ [Candidatus Acidoferrales bacterium]